jgi:phosphatidylglycerophosphate synthase
MRKSYVPNGSVSAAVTRTASGVPGARLLATGVTVRASDPGPSIETAVCALKPLMAARRNSPVVCAPWALKLTYEIETPPPGDNRRMNLWRDRLSRWLSPLARKSPVSPNAITLFALLLNLIAASLLSATQAHPAAVFAAIGLITVAGLADAFDGIVARERNLASRFGDFLDHICDRISDSALVVGWTVGSGVRPLLVIASLFMVMLDGYVGTQVEATFARREYEGVGRGEFVLALIVFPLASYVLIELGQLLTRFGTLSIPEWMTIVLMAFAALGIVQRVQLARRL